MTNPVAALALLALAGCSGIDHVALPQSVPRCVAWGSTITVSLPDGKRHQSAGCIETAPYPGEPAPPP